MSEIKPDEDVMMFDAIPQILIPNHNTKANGSTQLEIQPNLNHEQGKLGIKNLGNSCYFNVALQCLAHTKELAYYFASGKFKEDMIKTSKDNVEKDNLLHIFTQYFGEFINEMWSDSKEHINPSDLRNILIKLYPQFDNSFQQDCHEVLTLILDSLHQQLNKAENDNGMIIDNINLNLTPMYSNNLQKSLSQDYWNALEKFNKSFITDTFFGQLRSTIKCLACHETYMTYDPFSSLGLSIPNEYKILLYFIPLKKNVKTGKMFIKVNDHMQYKKIIEKVSIITDNNISSGIFYWVLNNTFIKVIDLDERCGDLMNRNAFLFFMESKPLEEQDQIDVNNLIFDNISHFYVVLNFNMFDKRNNSHAYKSASYPRVFQFNNSYLDHSGINNLMNECTEYIKNYIQYDNNEFDLLQDNTMYYTIKSVSDNNINLCLICGNKKEETFFCACINDIPLGEMCFDNSNILTYLNNQKDIEDFVMEMNINISSDILKYKELSRCRDYTQKYIQEQEMSLYDLLDYFTTEEKLAISDNYYCSTCGKTSKAIKKMEVNRFPQILTINLKRFRFENINGKYKVSRRGDNSVNSSSFTGEKNENLVNFQINDLDLKKYNKDISTKYDLYAVCYHNGKISRGHYKAICKHFVSCKWIEFDDKIVKILPDMPTNLINNDAYMLFYRQK